MDSSVGSNKGSGVHGNTEILGVIGYNFTVL